MLQAFAKMRYRARFWKTNMNLYKVNLQKVGVVITMIWQTRFTSVLSCLVIFVNPSLNSLSIK